MFTYLIRRLIGLAITVLLISIAVFAVLNIIPGDPAEIVLGIDANPDIYAATRTRLGLDKPAAVRYFHWLGNALSGDLGVSLRHGLSVAGRIRAGLTVTLPLAGVAILLAVAISIPIGVITALHHNRTLDYVGRATVQAGMAIPGFWLGILLILLFPVTLGWGPSGGFPGWGTGLTAVFFLLLPTIALSLPRAALLARMTRASLLEVLNEEYIDTVRGKGATEWLVITKHALRNSTISMLTLSGVVAAQLVAGSIIIENVFALPGVGRLVFQAVESRDLPVVQGTVVVIATLIAVINLAVDVAYGLLDPRIRYQ